MNRIIFSRPNKTLRGNFQAKGVMKMLDQNRRTWLAAQDMVGIFPLFIALGDELTFFNQMVDDASINSLVDKVLEEADCTETRASKMDVDDLLKCAFLVTEIRGNLSHYLSGYWLDSTILGFTFHDDPCLVLGYLLASSSQLHLKPTFACYLGFGRRLTAFCVPNTLVKAEACDTWCAVKHCRCTCRKKSQFDDFS